MKKSILVPALLGAAAVLSLSGCIAVSRHPTPPVPTVGQQLVDLQKAREAGALTEEEYQKQRARVLN